MDSIPKQPARAAIPDNAAAEGTRYDVALEPTQAWCLKGVLGEPDEIMIPGLLLDDLGNCSPVEASLSLPSFHKMLAMATLQENRMLAARHAPEPYRTKAEANVWAVDGRLDERRLTVSAIAALDRVVVDAFGTHCVETMRATQLVPGPKAWR